MVPGSDVSFFEVFGERVRRRKFCLLARRGCAITDPTMATGRAASCHKAHLVEEVEEMLRTQIDTNGTVVNFVRHLELSLTRKGGRDIVGVENDWRGCERKELRGWEDGQIVVGFIGVEILSLPAKIFVIFSSDHSLPKDQTFFTHSLWPATHKRVG